MSLLTKDQILGATDIVSERIKAWGGEVIVTTMTGYDRDKFESSMVGKQGGQNMVNIRAKLAAATLVDDSGNRLFTESDVQKLGKKSAAELDKVFAVAQRLNRFGDAEIEELAKNSSSALTEPTA